MKKDKERSWHCPLSDKLISEGLCLDINYERLEYFKGNSLKLFLKKTIKEINNTCENCPNMPLKQ